MTASEKVAEEIATLDPEIRQEAYDLVSRLRAVMADASPLAQPVAIAIIGAEMQDWLVRCSKGVAP